jgi:formamidopyrimidine-DNA glycosylase
MPELPEVETVAARLDAGLRGAVVESVRLFRRDVVKGSPRALQRALVSKTLRRVRRHGKRIICELSPDTELNFHLGMTGNLLVARQDEPRLDHTHLRMRFAGRSDELRFRDPRRFGGVWIGNGRSRRGGRFSSVLGPDALEVRLPEFRRMLERRRQIKALLLDQQVIAGLGNIYCDESLFRARLHPLTSAAELEPAQVSGLLGSIRSVLRQAIAAGGSSLRDYRNADGEPGWFRIRHRVYDREGEPCRRCRTAIEHTVVASRSTWFCPHCQPER